MSQRITLEKIEFEKLKEGISFKDKPQGPLVNMSDVETGNHEPFIVTILAYLPNNTLHEVCFSPSVIDKLELKKNYIYLTYYGVKVVTYLDRNDNRQLIDCRDFRVEYNCKEKSEFFDLYYIQFKYQLASDTLPVDAIIVRDDDEDPETDRGTVTMPAKDDQ